MTDRDDPYRTTHDWRSGSLSTTVVAAVAEGSDLGPTEFDLGDYVNPEALNALFRPRPSESFRDEGRVRFAVEGYRVVVHATGKILVHPASDPEVREE